MERTESARGRRGWWSCMPGRVPGAGGRAVGASCLVLTLSLLSAGCGVNLELPRLFAPTATATTTVAPPALATVADTGTGGVAASATAGAAGDGRETDVPTDATAPTATSAADATSGPWLPLIASDAPPAPAGTDPAAYEREYGFDAPAGPGAGLSASEVQRLAVMLPFALAATARWNARIGSQVEPQLLLFWTHAEGIGGHVSYSNCANETPPAGLTNFQFVANCDTPAFWQLGYGTQFSRVDVLKTAFIDMRGDASDAQLVQRVGQSVLDWDLSQNTVPRCGGYSCRFPAMTIDQILAGVSYTQPTADNWWASVLARDPAISCYILARTLVFFSHAETRDWVGCYYAAACWQAESNSLGDVLAAWPELLRVAGLG